MNPQQPIVSSPEDVAENFADSRQQTERAISSIISQVLKIDDVGSNDDLFARGARFSDAIKIASRVRGVFEIDLSAEKLFKNPTVAGLVQAVKEAQSSGTAVAHIEKRARGGGIPLSFTQEQLWFLDQLASGSPVYNVADYIVLNRTYNAAAMSKAVVELMCRHEVLRTAFTQNNGQPSQVVCAPIALALPELDLSDLREPERHQKWQKITHDEVRKTFDLSKAPLLRGTVVHFGRDEHRLLLIVHHIAVDEWSMEIIHEELRQLYEAFSHGRPSPLSEPSIQYPDFSVWQREQMRGDGLQKQIAYWKEEVAGVPTALELPTDKSRPPVPTFRGDTEFFEIPEELTRKLRSLGREQQATLFMTLEASFMVLLRRLSGQDDFLVGTPLSGRSQAETENVIGCFLNTVVLRARFNEETNFCTLLSDVRQRVLGAYEHPDLPYEYLVSQLMHERSMTRTPLLQVMFFLHNKAGASQMSRVSSNYRLHSGTSKFELSLTFSETENGLQGLFEYSTDLFEAKTIQRICGYYRTLLESIVENPDAAIATLTMLPITEREELLVGWNNTAVQRPERDLCLQALIEQQAAKTPDQPAVAFADESLTYGELDRRANQLARHLQKRGVGPDVLVGLSVERSLDMMVGLLGILKAGGAYIPLDPSFPADRLAYMVEDSKMGVLVTHRGLDARLLAKPAQVVRLDSDWDEISKQSVDRVVVKDANPRNLAYVLYTSGSTGKPKGVEIQHFAVVNFLLSMRKEPGFTAADTMLAVTTLSFDIAGLELYLPLISGGKVAIASYEETHDPVKLQERMEKSAYTVMQATPATWRALIHAGWKGSANIKLLCGGEAFPPDLAKELLSRCGQLWNMYGPTETTIWSTVHRVSSSDGSVPIGHPIDNTQVYVLDARRNLVPAGAIGELYIAGDGLARGYLNRPDLTADRFVPSPYVADARMYRTGDMARWLPGGTLECLGRVDNQVKIRGFRIELGEIEAILNNYRGIRQSAVVAREDGTGEKGLVAYYETREGVEAPVVADIRAHLKKSLPDYMVPSRFMAMAALPLTPNRKIDRKALPAPEDQAPASGQEIAAPQDEIEKMLAQIWSQLLKVKNIGSKSDFFELGGHSLAAVQMLAEVRNATGKSLPLATLFEASTIEALAAILRREGWTPSWSSLVPIRTAGSKKPLFLVHGAEGNVLLYRQLTDHLDPERPVYGLQSQGLNGDGKFLTTFQEMAALYLTEIKKVQPQGPYAIGGYCLGGVIAFEMAQQLAAAGEVAERVIMLDSYNMSRISQKTLWLQKPIHFAQNLWFHAANVLSLNAKERNNFLREKIDIALTRTKVRWQSLMLSMRGLNGADKEQNYPHLQVTKVNDHAEQSYTPKPYAGRIDVVRPKSHFAWQTSPSQGWSDYVRGDLQVHVVPIYPKGILVEPFCRQLADAINACLEQ